MIALMMLFAAASNQPPVAESAEEPPIEVRGPVICKRVTSSAETRVGRRQMCLTARQWNEVRDKAAEFYADLPRRNPRAAGRTIPDAFDIPQ